MYKTIMVAAALAAFAAPAAAQQAEQFASGMSAAVEGLGEGVAQGMGAGQSLFVTATGRAALPSPPMDAYVIAIEGQAASATEAARLRDQRLASAKALAIRYGVTAEIGAASYSRQNGANPMLIRPPAARASTPPPLNIAPPVPMAADKPITARTSVRFRATDAARLPAFLDALSAAGVDGAFSGRDGSAPNIFAGMTQALGFGPLPTVDDGVWDRAGQAAMAEARRQATTLATAAGRQLAEARQIMQLNRNVQGDSASVTVAVRYGLAPLR